ncbi:2TM domain-containing protein [Geodermatophilus obscurus]|uniref:2TM domain-containing protein n=1 Tax=Geodermatophilus obscurus TaxID=1861 RepID=UPI00094297DF
MGTDDPLGTSRSATAGTEKLHRRRELVDHLTGYLAVNATLWVSWLVVALAGGTWSPWPLVPTTGWGVGLVFHAWWVSSPAAPGAAAVTATAPAAPGPSPGAGPPGAGGRQPGLRGAPGRRPPTAAGPG